MQGHKSYYIDQHLYHELHTVFSSKRALLVFQTSWQSNYCLRLQYFVSPILGCFAC